MIRRAALVGCGRIGWHMADDPLMAGDVFTHAEAYVRCPQTRLVAVCDADLAEAQACATRWGVPAAYDDLVAMLEAARPEIVSIATPDSTHCDVARAVIEHGGSLRAILCEKPLASSVEEGQALVRLAADRGITLAVMHLRRYAQNIAALARFIRSGELGATVAVSGWYTKGVRHNGVHWFDQLRLLCGEAEWVEAADALGESGADPTLDVTIGLASGGIASLRAAAQSNFTVFEVDLMFERGRVRLSDSGYRIEVWRAAPSPRYTGYVELTRSDSDFGDRRDVMLHAIADLVAAVEDGRAPASTGEDGLAALRIAEAALKSAREVRRVSLAETPF